MERHQQEDASHGNRLLHSYGGAGENYVPLSLSRVLGQLLIFWLLRGRAEPICSGYQIKPTFTA